MSETQLAVVDQTPAALATTGSGGLGIDFGSKLFQLKPATLTIVQPNSQADGAIKGKLRISETGDQFDSLFVTLLVMPVEKRAYYAGKPGELNRTPENLMCFCSNVIRDEANREVSKPDPKAKVPGALRCYGCPKASWEKYRQTKERADIPPCDLYYYALLIDTEFKMPLQWYIRSTAKTAFEQAMQNLSRKYAMMKAKGLNPNIFDIGFKVSTVKTEKGKTVTYLPVFSDFTIISDAQREEFGEIYQQFVARRTKATNLDEDTSAEAQIDSSNQTIDAAVTEPTGQVLEGEIVI